MADSVKVFILHRSPITNATVRLMERGEACHERVVEALPLIESVMDEALLSLVTAHQHYGNKTEGGTAQ